jgi:prepilin-type N-terminal cleavage/methylation domain-containing protein
MRRHGNSARQGLTLTELIVVMAIIAVLAAVAVPSFVRLGFGARDEVNRSASELYSMLRAAKLYAVTYRVNTAVVYNLDNYQSAATNPANTPGLAAAITDTVTGGLARTITGAAIMYQLRDSRQNYLDGSGGEDAFVLVPQADTEFRALPEGAAVLLVDPDTGQLLYSSHRPRYEGDSGDVAGGPAVLGMRGITAILSGGPWGDGPVRSEQFLAHVFTPAGKLDAPPISAGNMPTERQRLRILVGPGPALDPEVRLIDASFYGFVRSDGSLNLVAIPVEIYPTTGRINLVS